MRGWMRRIWSRLVEGCLPDFLLGVVAEAHVELVPEVQRDRPTRVNRTCTALGRR